jgi:hypothetical protein
VLNASSGWGGPPNYGPPGGGMPPGGMPPGGAPPPGAPPPGGYGYPPGAPPGGYPPQGGGGYPPQGGGGYPPQGGGGGYGPYGGGFAPPPGGPYAPAPMGGAVGAWSPTDAISAGWNAVKGDFAGVALPLAVGVFVMVLPGAIVNGIGRVVMAMVFGRSELGDMTVMMGSTFGLIFVVMLINALVQGYMLGGLISFSLKVMRGQKPDFGEVFGGGPLFGSMVSASILNSLGILVGYALCIVPGIIVALGWSLYSPVVVERRIGGVDALKQSWQLTTGHKVNIFLWGLLMFVVAIVCTIACVIPALLIAAPIGFLSLAYIYMRIVGEQPAVPA